MKPSMNTSKRQPRSPRPQRPPSYQELAELVTLLTERNIANIDRHDCRFVKCFTYGADCIPDHWWRAIKVREALAASNIVTPRVRDFDHDVVVLRSRRGKIRERRGKIERTE